jgi:hypothetical protein
MYKRSVFVFLLVVLLTLVGTIAGASNNRNFRAHLSGDQEVPARETQAQGQAIFNVSKDESSLHYKLIVANIENVRAAHIHCGLAGANGTVGLTLFTQGPAGPVNGVLAEATVTGPDSGNGCQWSSIADIVTAIRNGNAYVNVHTNDGVPPSNTGPGDFSGGEIRGQIH